MREPIRNPRDVIGTDPLLVEYWNQIPPHVQLQLLESDISVSTLGELKKLSEELNINTTISPE